MAATGNDNQLLGRVKRIMNVKTTNFNYGQKLFAFVFIAFLLISIAWLSPDQHINNARHHNEQSAAKSSAVQNKKDIINNDKGVWDTERNMTVSAPAPKTITISTKIISSKDTLHIITTGSASIPLSFPAVPQPALPPVPPPPPAPAFSEQPFALPTVPC